MGRLEHFPIEVVPGSAKKMRQNKELEPRSDSEGTERALVVVAQEVIPGQAESADGCFLAQASVRPMPVVAVEPSRQFVAALV